jgi:2-deoxy-D-gluconate 3-dehydrogenase
MDSKHDLIDELFSLDGRVALVTGGNGGLGRAIALGLRGAGATVAVTGQNMEKNKVVAQEIGNTGMVLELDVRNEHEVESVVTNVVERFGRLDILINNAGTFRGGPVLDLSLEDWRNVLDVHLTGAFLCSKHAAQAMLAKGRGGKIINIGSVFSFYGHAKGPDYATAKAGVLGLTRSLAIQLRGGNIQVNAILPGWFETDMTKGLSSKPRGEEIRRRTPAGRFGNPEDLVGAAVFLASSASDFVTGTHIAVDGGYLISDRPLHD